MTGLPQFQWLSQVCLRLQDYVYLECHLLNVAISEKYKEQIAVISYVVRKLQAKFQNILVTKLLRPSGTEDDLVSRSLVIYRPKIKGKSQHHPIFLRLSIYGVVGTVVAMQCKKDSTRLIFKLRDIVQLLPPVTTNKTSLVGKSHSLSQKKFSFTRYRIRIFGEERMLHITLFNQYSENIH